MKLLVLSDSHRDIQRMRYAAGQARPDAVLHLGDHIGDARELSRHMPGIDFYMVRGNCDFQAPGQDELLLTLEGVRIYAAHGHAHGVKGGLETIAAHGRRVEAGLVLYGHTHQASVRRARGVWLMNPGQTERHDSIRPASYGVVTVKDGAFECETVFLPPP
ncbi:MAG: YfcE family phosphodiesterase [Oscillospiraceae bacterium]|nr:YfcE family phosphodiesterase [Oscillospiraceae bacterium]